MIKRLVLILISFCMIFSLTSCVSKQTEPANVSNEITLIDQAGRTVVLNKVPERLVSGYYISTSVVIAIGQSDKLVGVEAKANSRPIYKLSAPSLIDLPNTGSAKAFDLEGCASLEPDLVILPIKLKDKAEALEELGIKTLLVNPETDESLIEMIELINTALGGTNKGEELLEFIFKSKEDIAKKLNGVNTPRVYLTGNSDYLTTCGQSMYQSELIKSAGGKNVAKDLKDTYWATVSYEQLLAWDPEYIIIAAEAEFGIEDILKDDVLSNLTAIKNKNVYKMPNKAEAWDSPVPSSFLGVEFLASILHPDKISEKEYSKLVSTYYKQFYGFDY